MTIGGGACPLAYDAEAMAWVGAAEVPELGGAVEVNLFSHHPAPRVEQLEAVSRAVAFVLGDGQRMAKERVFAFHQRFVRETLAFGNPWGHDTELAETADACWATLSAFVIDSFDEVERGLVVCLIAECDWNLDGGVEIEITGDDVPYAGQQR